MKNRLIFFLAFMPSLALSEPPQPIGPISFSGGLNLASLSTLIPNEDSPDMCNCSPEIIGSMSKKNGSERFISQAISSQGFTSLYSAYSAPSSTQIFKAIFGTSGGRIVISTMEATPQWVTVSSNHALGQHFNYVTIGGKILIAGSGLKENVKQYNIASSTQHVLIDAFSIDPGSSIINPRGKYQIGANGYYILANVQISTEARHLPNLTTYYSSRLLFSFLNQTSSMTVQRFIDFNQNDGEEITGAGMLYGGSSLVSGDFKTIVNVFKPSRIGELAFTVLDLPSRGGDFVFSEVAMGLGLLVPRTLVNLRNSYAFWDKSGIVLWDRTEVINISGDIKPLLDEVVRAGKHKNAVMTYYPKKEWLILSLEHPQRFPKGVNNYVLIYDLRIGKWFPFCNWLADSFAVQDNVGETSRILYGDSNDGYVHIADLETRQDDSRQEFLLDVMDSSFSWVGSTQNILDVREGTASLRISGEGIYSTSITRMAIFDLGDWNDKQKVTLDDRISFKAFAHNVTSITSLRVDFEVNNVTGTFDTNFSSVTISSNAFIGNRIWTTFEIPLTSFSVRPDWTDLAIESVPFYNRFSVYGIRFVLSGVDISSCMIDDLRLVGRYANPNKMYRYSKLFDMQSPAFKGFGNVLLLMEKGVDSSFSMDIYNDFGQKTRTEQIEAEVSKEILIFRHNNRAGLALLNSIDFSVNRQTSTVQSHWNCFNGIMDEKTIVCGDRRNDRLIAFDRNDLSTFSVVYGAFGIGTSNFNLIHELAQYSKGYLISDLNNQRVKNHTLKNLEFIKQYGELGNNATNFHQPTGVGADDSFFYVSDESNNRILKLNQSTFGIVLEVSIPHNTNADSSLIAGDKSLFMAYNHVSSERDDTVDLFLEKRDKANMELLNRVLVRPIGITTGSYIIQGSIGLLGRYVLVAFSDDEGQANPRYYLQKRLQFNFDIVSQYSTYDKFFTASGYSKSFKPLIKVEVKNLKVTGRYLQLKFYDDKLDNYWRLYNFTPLGIQEGLTYQ